jgi:hypothetical protein
MPTLKEADPVAYAIAHARRKADIERIATQTGCPEGKVRSWRHGTTSLAPWVIRVIADVLRLDDTVLEHHWQCRQRHAEDVASQREQDAA